jgi:hypothetical protein
MRDGAAKSLNFKLTHLPSAWPKTWYPAGRFSMEKN